MVCGLTTAQIARAFLVPETTVAQRITRAKRKITDAGIPYRVPAADELSARLTEVLAVIYLLFNEGYLSSRRPDALRDLVDDAEWLAPCCHQLMPTEPEVAGLLALIRLHRARAAARFDADGDLVLLGPGPVAVGPRAIAAATAPGPRRRTARPALPAPGRHRRLPRRSPPLEDTDWEQILLLYDMLCTSHRHRSPRRPRRGAGGPPGPPAGPGGARPLAEALGEYHLFTPPAPNSSATSDNRCPLAPLTGALELTNNPAEQALLQRRVDWD